MEEAGSSSFRILEKEKFSCPSCRARSSRSLPLSLQEPACHVELSAFQSKPSSSGVLINDGDDVPLAWKCEFCRQTTLIDGVVPRSARRGFGEPHFSVKLRRRQARPHAAVPRSRGLESEVFMVRCILPFAGRSSCDSVSWSESTTWCHDVVSVPNCCRSRQHASKSGGSSRSLAPS